MDSPGLRGLAGTCTLSGMGEDRETRRTYDGHRADMSDEGSGWTTTDTAARALGVSPRTVRRFIERGDLEGRKLKDGIVEIWEVSIDSLQNLRDRRGPEGRVRRPDRRESVEGHSTPVSTPDMTDLVRDLTADLIRTSSEATEYRVRLELTEHTQSTLEEEQAAERNNREQAERERDELRKRLESLQEMRDALETGAEPVEGTDTPTDREQAETVVQRRSSWWRRFFGFHDRESG